MDQAVSKDSLDSEEVAKKDDEIDEQLDWEEELENEYGNLPDAMSARRDKAMGPGFSKQKQVVEENKFYRGSVKKGINIRDKRKK